MSEVKRWKLKGFLPGVEGECKAVFQPTVVMADDFDRVTAENSGLQALLTAADEALDKADDEFSLMSLEAGQRLDLLVGLLRDMRKGDHAMISSFYQRIDAALNPSEGRGDGA